MNSRYLSQITCHFSPFHFRCFTELLVFRDRQRRLHRIKAVRKHPDQTATCRPAMYCFRGCLTHKGECLVEGAKRVWNPALVGTPSHTPWYSLLHLEHACLSLIHRDGIWAGAVLATHLWVAYLVNTRGKSQRSKKNPGNLLQRKSKERTFPITYWGVK